MRTSGGSIVRRGLILIATTGWIVSVGWSVPEAVSPQQVSLSPTPPTASDYAAVVKQYCVVCHNERLKTAGLLLDHVDLETLPAHAEIWEKVVRKLRRGAMPPQGARRPDQATLDGLTIWLETELDHAAAAHPNPGEPLVHRLNRAEYANAIRDLLSLDIDVSSLLPPDDSAYGFDNNSDVLGFSPVRVESYVSAAGTVSASAVGEPGVSPGAQTYLVRQDRSQDQHIEGLPLGTVGGLAVRHTFPLAGEYVFQIALLRTNTATIIGLERPHQLEITVDGKRVFLDTVGGGADAPKPRTKGKSDDDVEAQAPIETRFQIRIPVEAGPRTITADFIQRRGANTRQLQDFVRTTGNPYDPTGLPHIRTLTVTGPFNATGSGDTPSRRRIFICRPESLTSEGPCARQIISTLARRAYRRPVNDEDLSPLLSFYEAGRREGNFETGIEMALQRILASPKFVLRVERDPPNVASGSVYRLSDLELASRLSFFLWSSIPDDELLEVANQGQLGTPEMLERQVRRMLADPRAEALVTNFAGQWLQLRNLRNIVPDPQEFPDFDDQLREGFARETELFFGSIMREDRNVLDLLTADYTFVNERVAKHYSIPYIYGSHFRRVTLTDEARRGLLGQGSILTVTSHANRTAPVLRGKWILDNLLGTPPPPPPPNVMTDLPDPAEGEKPLTMRQRMEVHRANPVCANCHKLMDPIGLAMENFDAVGAWRAREAGGPIDATTQLYDGTKVDGVIALRQALLKRPEVVVGTVTERLLTYALGRGLQSYDMPVVRGIVRDAADRDYRFSSLILGIVSSMPFQMRISDAKKMTATIDRPAAHH
jgi:mono/diheme cytochrome c family protein